MIKGNIKNVKSVELIKATSALPYNTIGDYFERIPNTEMFTYTSTWVTDASNTVINSQISEAVLEDLKEDFKVVEYTMSKEAFKFQEMLTALEKAKKLYEEEIKELTVEREAYKTLCDSINTCECTCDLVEDRLYNILNKIQGKLEEYETKFEEIKESDNTNEWADEAMTVYQNLIILLNYLKDDNIQRTSK